jgi:uncharacterized membrane protein YecN with MAPEG domain
MHVAPYFTALGLLTIIHAIKVIKLRRQHLIALGDGGNRELEVRIRIFGNHIEYAPIGMILLMALEWVQAPVWYLHLCGGTLITGRLLHATGLAKARGKSLGRFYGMILTFLSLALASLGVTLFSLI